MAIPGRLLLVPPSMALLFLVGPVAARAQGSEVRQLPPEAFHEPPGDSRDDVMFGLLFYTLLGALVALALLLVWNESGKRRLR